MKNFIKKHKFLSGIVLLILLVVAYFIYSSATKTQAAIQYVVTAASKQTLVVSMSGTGQVAALNQISIKPQSGSTQSANTVTSVNIQQGQDVKAGQVIATLDQKNTILAINQAKASVESSQASYDSLLAGPTKLDLQSSQNSVSSAQTALANAQRNLNNVKAQQQTAVNNSLRSLLNSSTAAIPAPTNYSSDSTPTISGSYGGTDQGSYIIAIYSTGQGLQFYVSGLENGTGYINTASAQAIGTKGLYLVFPDPTLARAGDSWTISLPNTQANSYLSNNNSYQTALQNQSQAITSAQASVDSAQASLEQANNALEQKQAPATAAQIASAKSQLDTSQASLATAQNNYANTIITAPFDGQVAAVNVQKGDSVSSATVIATLVTKQQLAQISINEVDAAKVALGQKVTMTFDAVPDLTITGKVAQVDIIGTVSQGVVSYNVQISLDTQDNRIKPGMSVSADIITAVRQDVLAVPSSAVKTQGTQSYVQIFNSASPAPVAGGQSQVASKVAPTAQLVTTGLSNDAMTEITSGLEEGDLVVIQTIASGTGATASSNNSRTTGGASGIRIPGIGGFGGGRPAGN